jgi:putative FmdB family regulatory protein
MPTYEYHCSSCGHEFEQFQAITDGPLRKCPRCKQLKLKRLIGSGAGIIFKGSGFYETDYRSQSYKEGERKESSAKTPESSSVPTSKKTADSKPKGDSASKSRAKKAS